VEATDTNVEKLRKIRTELDAAATQFLNEINAYISQQDKTFAAEIAAGTTPENLLARRQNIERAQKIIDDANAVRVINFKAQALRQPEFLQQELPRFAAIEKSRQELVFETKQELDLQQLASIGQALAAYKAGTESALKNYQESSAIYTTRIKIDDDFNTIVNALLARAIKRTLDNASAAVTTLNFETVITIGSLIAQLFIGLLAAFLIIRGANKALKSTASNLT